MDLKKARKLIEFDNLQLDQSLSGIALDDDSLTKAYLIVYIDSLFKSGELNGMPDWKRNAIRKLKDRTKKTYKKVHYVIRTLDEKNNKWINVEQTSTDNFQNAQKKARRYRNKHNKMTDIVLVAETTITVTEEHNTGVSFARNVKYE
jgi:hypothetical protein